MTPNLCVLATLCSSNFFIISWTYITIDRQHWDVYTVCNNISIHCMCYSTFSPTYMYIHVYVHCTCMCINVHLRVENSDGSFHSNLFNSTQLWCKLDMYRVKHPLDTVAIHVYTLYVNCKHVGSYKSVNILEWCAQFLSCGTAVTLVQHDTQCHSGSYNNVSINSYSLLCHFAECKQYTCTCTCICMHACVHIENTSNWQLETVTTLHMYMYIHKLYMYTVWHLIVLTCTHVCTVHVHVHMICRDGKCCADLSMSLTLVPR